MPDDPTLPRREFIGYGPNPPDPKWPGGARVAVNFCINYEEGGERCILNGDDRSEMRVSDVAVESRIGRRDLNVEQSYEYGSRVGYWRILKAFTRRELPATINLVGVAAEKNPVALRAMTDAGFDVQLHGWKWIDFDTLGADEERAMIGRAVDQAVELTGERPIGYYAGLPSINTRRLVVEDGGFLYDSDCYNDDLPYWTHDFGRPHLVIPYSLDTNDSKFGRGDHDYQTAGEFVTYIADTFDTLYAEGGEAPKMMTIGLHARLIGRPGRIVALERILDHVTRHEDVWICRRGDIARHWIETHPPAL